MKIAFIGGGNMATALAGGLIRKGHSAGDIRVVEIEDGAREKIAGLGVAVFKETRVEAVEGARLVVLAIKPQQMREVAVKLGPLLKGQIVLSIAAGIRLTDLARWLGARNAVLVRAMPNTPALVGEGITGLCGHGADLKPEERQAVETLMGAVGDFVWLRDESQMDAVTAVSGSGPAYVFWLIEQLARNGEALGLAAEASKKLAIQTVLGAARLAAGSPDSPGTLRQKVTSKGGTTEAALQVFEKEQLAERFRKAIEAAQKRGAELGEMLGKD